MLFGDEVKLRHRVPWSGEQDWLVVDYTITEGNIHSNGQFFHVA